MKRPFKVLLAVLVSCTLVFALWPSVALAAGESGTTADNLEWEVLPGDASLRITGYNGAVPAGTAITIPATIDTGLGYGTLPVTEIGTSAFSGDAGIESLDLSGATNLTNISNSAFFNTHITALNVPGNVTTIGSSAFRQCQYLQTVTLSEGVTTIYGFLFYGCTALHTVSLPSTLHTIPDYMFDGCKALEQFTIPATITIIGEGAFLNSGLHGITVPSTVITVQGNAFEHCLELGTEPVVWSCSSVNITQGMFKDCPELHSFTIPDNVTIIWQEAFQNSGLESIAIPAGVTSIRASSFAGTVNLTAFAVLGDTVNFGSDVFLGSAMLTDGCIIGHDPSSAKTYAASINVPFEPFLTLTLSPSSGEIYTGGRIFITPNLAGGIWSFDNALLSRNGNEFTGLKAGTAHVVFETDHRQTRSADIVIRQAELPPTGQDFSPALWLVSLALLTGFAAMGILNLRRRHARAR